MSPARARLAVDIFAGIVIVSVAMALAHLTWRFGGYPGVGPAAAPVAPGGAADVDIRPIIALAPFGTANVGQGDGGDGAIKLRGIFMSVPADTSVALIAGPDGKVASYGIGQAIGGGTIEGIEPDHIVLRTAVGQRTIGFNPTNGAAAASAAGASGSDATSKAATVSVVAPPPPLSGAAAIRASIPQSVRGTLPPVTAPAPDLPGASSGYRVGSSPNPALLAAGLKPGDVVEKVNGSSINAGSNERDIIAAAMARGSARVELLRDGQRISLTVSGR